MHKRSLAKPALAIVALGAILVIAGPATAAVSEAPFGQTDDGKPITIYTLSNAKGMQARVTSWGATLVSLMVPDRRGHMADVVIGYDNGADYVSRGSYYGATIGRYANRIANGTFTLDGKTYTLPKNAGPNTLHGGKGFDKRLWRAQILDGNAVRLTYLSEDGEEGFPGRLTLNVTYRLREDNALSIRYEATTDKPTVAAFTNHAYFNLSGDRTRTYDDEVLTINADRYTPTDATGIPTGELKAVEGTPYDFRKATVVGSRMGDGPGQLHGYDTNYVLNKETPGTLSTAAVLSDPSSGRVMETLTTEPGLQLYTANTLKPPFVPRTALCLETQHFPDSPNKPSFPSTVLRPGEVLTSETVYLFRIAP